jgi:hypothetical protein
MQQVTSTSHQVSLNTQPARRFGFETNWKQVTSPSGGNIITKTVNAVIAVFVNLAKSIVNLALSPLNLVHRLIYGKPANTITIEDDLEIQQDTVTLDIAEATQMDDEKLPEPVVVESGMKNWQKAALIGSAALVGTLVLIRGGQYANNYFGNKIPVLGDVDNFLFGTIPNGISSGVTSAASGARYGFCKATFEKICKA